MMENQWRKRKMSWSDALSGVYLGFVLGSLAVLITTALNELLEPRES